MTSFRFYERKSGSDPQGGLPIGFEDVGMRMFFLRADQKTLEDVCDYYFNSVAEESGHPERWKPYGVVIATLATYEKIYSIDFPEHGYMTQQELVFGIPAIKTTAFGRPSGLGVITPYCFVDNDWSMVAGREVLGYPKLQGWFDLPGSDAKGLRDVSGMGVKANVMPTFAPDTALQRELIFATERQGENPGVELDETVWPYGPLDLYVGGDQKLIPGPDELPDLVRDVMGDSQGNVGLKQLRSAGEFLSAGYQGLSRFALKLDHFQRAEQLSAVRLHIPRYDSLTIAESLGIAMEPDGSIEPFWAQNYYANFHLCEGADVAQRCYPTDNAAHSPDVSDIYREAIEEAVDQYRESSTKLLQFRYGPIDYVRDLQDHVYRSIRVSQEVSGRLTRKLDT